jgi:hypothetical protein
LSGSTRKLFCVMAILAGPDISSSISLNPAYPGLSKTTWYDGYSGTTFLAVQNLDTMETTNIVGFGDTVASWGGGYSCYGHFWYEWS